MPPTEAWTTGRLLQWTTDYLKQRGGDTPRLDAEVLLAHVLGCQRIQLYTAFDALPDEAARAAFRELVRQRAEGVPVAYLVGRREFYSLSFRVTPDVLVPRPETEFLVIRLLDLASPADRAWTIADVGTGSGIIAVCAAKKLAQSRVLAIDVSEQALAVAAANASEHKVSDRIEFVAGDLLADLPADITLDFVVANLPYITEGEFAELPPDVREHEPRGALVGGPRGTEIIDRLIPQAAERLSAQGWLLLEISPQLEAAVRGTLNAAGCWQVAPTIKDLAGLARVVTAQRL
jgi:release factor glutamine methyltransferase